MIELTILWYSLGVLFLMLLGVIMCDELNDRFKRIPFGPIRVPIIGNLHQLYFYDRKYIYKALTKLGAAHGNTMKMWFGLVGSVVISGYERINEVIRNEDWVGVQDETWILDRTSKGKNTTVTENADSIRVWASVKLYANQVLKDYGFGKGSKADAIIRSKCEDLRGLLQYWKANDNGNVEVTKNFFLPFVLSTNWAFVTGELVSVTENAMLQQLLKLIKKWEELTIITSKYLDNWPNFCSSLPIKNEYKKLCDLNGEIRELFQDLIQQYRVKGDYKKSPKNLIDKFLQKIDEREETPDKRNASEVVVFTDNALVSILFNLFVPSTLVLQSSLNFACYALCQYPNIQEKLRAEIIKAKPRNSTELGTTEFARMPYLTAFLLEVYRLGNVIPMEKRKLLKTIREGDTRVTHGMTLVINYDSANNSTVDWNDPAAFSPSRFLDSSGTNIVEEHKLLALVAAKRLCIGELVARQILQHSVTTLVHHFNFSSDTTGATGFSRPEWGVINNPPPYHLKINQSY